MSGTAAAGLTVGAVLNLALARQRDGRPDQAERLCREVLRQLPGLPDAWHLLGLALLAGERPAEAADALRTAIALKPQDPVYAFNLATALHRLGQAAAAAAVLRRAIRLCPDFEAAYANLAAALRVCAPAQAATVHEVAAARWPDRAEAHLALADLELAAGRAAAARRAYRRALRCRPDLAAAWHGLGASQARLGRNAAAQAAWRRALALDPARSETLVALGEAACDGQAPEAGLRHLERAAALDPDDWRIRDILVMRCHDHGRLLAALDHGAAALALKDRAACAARPAVPFRRAAPPFRPDARMRNVIAFALWGDAPRYTLGAIENARLAAQLYPEWTCRIYHDASVPAPVLRALRALGCQLVDAGTLAVPVERPFWRFLPADDPELDRFLCRDCDSRLNPAERAAVEAWIASGRRFHVMRDHVCHAELILAGLWGGVAGALPSLAEAARRFRCAPGNRWADQEFLRAEVWPHIKADCLIHDRWYRLFGAVDFPPGARRPAGQHIGMCEPPPADLEGGSGQQGR